MNKQTLDFEKPLVELEQKIEELKKQSEDRNIDLGREILGMQNKLESMRAQIYGNLSAWQRVQISRHIARPFFLDYIRMAFTDFVELKGDRLFGDDASMPGGLASIGGIRCVVIGQQKGRDMKENLLRNFGSPHPEGYRKALRLMRLAEKFGIPVVALIDTPGAYPGVGAEERHIAEAIAVNIRDMMILRTPVVSVVIGEGGSGGALGIGVADRVLILENAYYSVISPEGCAAILWKHRKHAPEAAQALKLSSPDLLKMGLVDGVIPEPTGGAHCNPEQAAENLKSAIVQELQALIKCPVDKLLRARYDKFRKMGVFEE
ncbi:MAG: acetyl-CoA carboxylase carboxyl transferase subunit alpha [Spartobacteria bacterium AMD-G4]|nr:MAG: acetyl-CoA carboxylase carboxyl transferase subunit alpha [Spartobacteria bacterium AMD-G4]